MRFAAVTIASSADRTSSQRLVFRSQGGQLVRLACTVGAQPAGAHDPGKSGVLCVRGPHDRQQRSHFARDESRAAFVA